MERVDPRVQYWDSTLFISFLTGRQSERVEIIRKLLEQLERGAIRVVIATFVIAEVRSAPAPTARTVPEKEDEVRRERYLPEHTETVKRLFRTDQLEYRALTPAIAEKAAEIGDLYPRLLPADCVHIATALSAEADVLFTYDGAGQRRRGGAMLRYDGRIDGLRITAPYVSMGPLFDQAEHTS